MDFNGSIVQNEVVHANITIRSVNADVWEPPLYNHMPDMEKTSIDYMISGLRRVSDFRKQLNYRKDSSNSKFFYPDSGCKVFVLIIFDKSSRFSKV